MLVKSQGQPTYFFSKNLEITLWHRKLGHECNTGVVEASTLNNRIDITIEDDHSTKNLSSNQGTDNEKIYKDLGRILTADNKHRRHLQLMIIFNDPENIEIKKLCIFYIESKYRKIIRHKNMTSTTKKLQEIYANQWGPHDLPLLLKKIYIGLVFDKFIHKFSILFLKNKDEFFNAFQL